MKVSAISLNVDLISKERLVERLLRHAAEHTPASVCVANVHMVIEGHRNPQFARAVNSADYVITDGMPLVWFLKNIHHIKQERITGMDLLPELLARAAEEKQRVFFYGGTEDMLMKTRDHLETTFPGLQIAGMYSPPFRSLSTDEEKEILAHIREAKPDWVFVVLGCPKQERWMANMRDQLNAVMIGIGGALPVMIGIQKRAPLWAQRAGLEWFFRLCQEPKRLAKRYGVTNTLFLYLYIKELFKKKFDNRFNLPV